MPDALDQQLDILLNPSVNSSLITPDNGQDHANHAMPHTSATLLSSNSSAPETPSPPYSEQPNNLWERVLESVPLGVAVIDGDSGETTWTNTAMRCLLLAGVGMSDVLEWHPYDYLPGLEPTVWEAVRQRALHPNDSIAQAGGESGRFQFVHHATRNIAYWEWTVTPLKEPIDGPAKDRPHLLLTVQNVSDIVMNERQLATTVRASQQARRDAEALGNLAQLVNRSLTAGDLLRTIVQEAANYFDTQHAAVLLMSEDRLHFEVGYSIGLWANADETPQEARESVPVACLQCKGTPAGECIAQRKTLLTASPVAHGIPAPLLADGKAPAALISSPIQQNGRIYGVVEVYFDEAREMREDSASLLSAFAEQTAVGLLKADLYDQIATQRGQLQSIFDNAPVEIIYFDANGTAVTVNAAAARSWGSPSEDIVGKDGATLLPDLPPQVFAAALGGKPFHASHVVTTRISGREVVYDVSLVPVRSDGVVAGLLLLTFEVTELVYARQEADLARREAEDALAAVRATQSQMVQMEKMRAVGELAQGVAHDINNALMAVLGYTELAEDDIDDPVALEGHLATIKKAALDASSTVQRLNRFAKRGIATNGDHTDLNEVVKDVVQMTRPRWKDAANKEGRSYEVETDLQPVPPIIGEPSGLREVLINMIHNALNAMPQGGTLKLSTRPHGDKEVEIEVADSGAGMTPDVMRRIFDPFFTTRGVEGTGLGLAVSWTIIERHGGTILVESEPGHGTRFLIRLPISLSERPDPVWPVPLPLPNAAPGTPVLVVDDEPIVSGVLSSILGRHGYRVTIASSAQEALEKLREPGAAFRLVMTDHGMPGMNGLQMIAEIKRTHPDLPVLMLTGWGETILQTNVVEAMPDAVLGKPINQSDLLQALSKLIPQTPGH
jgi:PAS domain S-box-containing protein